MSGGCRAKLNVSVGSEADFGRPHAQVRSVPRPEVTRRTWKSPLPCIQRDAFWLRTLKEKSGRSGARHRATLLQGV